MVARWKAIATDHHGPEDIEVFSLGVAHGWNISARNPGRMEPGSGRVLRAMESGRPLVRFPIYSRWQDGYMGASRAFGPDRPQATGAHSVDGRTNQFSRAGNEP